MDEWIVGPTEPYPDEDYWVILRFIQLEGSSSASAAVHALLRHTSSDIAPDEDPAIFESMTIVDAITPDLAFGVEPDGFSQIAPQDRLPSQDPFNRCIDSIDRIGRAYRIAADLPIGRITYERVFPLVGTWRSAEQADMVELLGFKFDAWGDSTLMRLNHYNISRPLGPEIDDELSFRMMAMAHAQLRGYPFFIWRERMLEAQRAFHVDGSFSTTVVLAQTASEVFLDGLLSLLLWEEGEAVRVASSVFASGTAVSRMIRLFHDRLGGRWAISGGGATAIWHRNTVMLRHRVVHLGFEPSRTEARLALEAASALQAFAFDRLVERRNRYKRTTLMTVGVEGLAARDLFRGAIARFFHKEGPHEPDWREDFARWQIAIAESSAVSKSGNAG